MFPCVTYNVQCVCCLVLLQSLMVLTCGKHVYSVCVRAIHCSMVEGLLCYPVNVYCICGTDMLVTMFICH